MSFLSLFTLVSCIKLTDGFMPSTSYATSPNRVQPLFSTITAPVTLPDGLTKMVKRQVIVETYSINILFISISNFLFSPIIHLEKGMDQD